MSIGNPLQRILWVLSLVCFVAVAAQAASPLAFEPCLLTDSTGLMELSARCGGLTVAEDPTRPDGRQIELRVAILEASGQHMGSPVVFLAGGPGQAASEAFPGIAAALAPLRRGRDIILLDQRGTGSSAPLDCPAVDNPLGKQGSEELLQLTRRCLEALTADPRFFTTSVAVTDLELLREALGHEKWHLLGVSYGTRVAMEYARRYPDRVASMVLDGVVPPPLALGSEHGRNARRVLDLLFNACRREAGCAERLGDPAEHLHRLRQQLGEGLELSVADPRTAEPQSLWLDEDLLGGVIRLLLYAPESAALLPLLLRDATGDPTRLAAQALMVNEQLARQISQGMELAVICSEDLPFFPEDARDDHSLLGGALVESLISRCSIWPKGEIPADFKEPLVSDVPTLLLSGERDPVTPPVYAEAVARGLSDSRHLVVPGQHHNVLARGCLPDIIAEFIAAGSSAELDTACVERMGPLPFFSRFAGPEP